MTLEKDVMIVLLQRNFLQITPKCHSTWRKVEKASEPQTVGCWVMVEIIDLLARRVEIQMIMNRK
jgi:hypothetical protein